jgi:indole-3-glycerol phosphate synthase
MTILDKIFATKRQEVEGRRQAMPLPAMRRLAEAAPAPHDFAAALRAKQPGGVRLIAEVKKASPSRGLLSEHFDALKLAAVYRDGGAAAISVLTDEQYFQGSLSILAEVAALTGRPPLLRKDFLYDPYQVYEARAGGADAVLLIAAALDLYQLADLNALAGDLGMAALVEVHNEAELSSALGCRPALVGVNNRDLHTFTVSLETCLRLRPAIPSGILAVAESGIHTREDVACLERAGFDGMLVGERLVTAPDPAAAMRELLACR